MHKNTSPLHLALTGRPAAFPAVVVALCDASVWAELAVVLPVVETVLVLFFVGEGNVVESSSSPIYVKKVPLSGSVVVSFSDVGTAVTL